MKTPLLFALAGTLSVASWAQEKPTADIIISPANGLPTQVISPPSTDQTTKRMYRMTLKNVKPTIMAYWLDPKNHEVPVEFSRSIPKVAPSSNMEGQSLSAVNSGPFQLPAGVDRVVAVDPQNALLVFGTPAGVQALSQLVTFLDKPLRQVELETRFVSMDKAEASKLFAGTSPTTQIVRGKTLVANVDSLVKQKKAVVLTAPRVLALNNLTAEIDNSVTAPVQLQGPNPNVQALSEKAGLVLSTEYLSQFTPTINNDDTITVLSHIQRSVQLKSSLSADQALPIQKWQTPDVIVNVRDGETVALLCDQRGSEDKDLSQALVVFLTARIVTRSTNK